MKVTKQGRFTVVGLPATFGIKEAAAFRQLAREQMEKGNVHLVADASSLKFIDSTAVGVLVKCLRDTRANSGNLFIRNLQGPMLEFFTQTSLDRLFPMQEGERTREAEEALFTGAVSVKLEMEYAEKGDVGVFRLSGIMDYPEGLRHFRERILLGMEEKRKFLLDMEALTYLDSMSLGGVIALARILQQSQGELRICNANELVKDLLRTVSTDRILPVFETPEDAMEGWRSKAEP